MSREASHTDRARPPRRGLRRALAGAAALWGFAGAPGAFAEAVPGPPLEPATAAPGAYCPPRGSADSGVLAFAGALAAIAWIARRRRDPA